MLPPSPSQSPSTLTLPYIKPKNPSSLDFSPPLIAMVVVVAAAFVAITYSRLISRHVILLHRRYRRYCRRRRLLRSYVPSPDLESGPYDPSDGFHVSSPFGLDDSVIKSIPLSMFSLKSCTGGAVVADCAVCLLEFEDKEYIRTLPVCHHAFHVDCIDIWLQSHPNCPLCRAGVVTLLRPEPSSRIRPDLDVIIFENSVVEPLDTLLEGPETLQPNPARASSGEITQELGDPSDRRDFLLKRSYSFSFERNLGSERLAFEPAMTSPWRYRKGLGGGFWNKRASPFGSMTKPRLFPFTYYKGMKSPFFRRRGGFFPFSERGGSSSRRSKSMASPMFMRSAGPTVGTFSSFSSSRLRSGDPEALLSPDRYNRR